MPSKTLQIETETAQKRLLDVAERLFAERGFDGTSVRLITSTADCNLNAVNYHFQSKDNLYRTVFERLIDELQGQRIGGITEATQDAGIDDGPSDGVAMLTAVVEAFARAYVEPLVQGGRGKMLLDLMLRELVDPKLPRDLFLSQVIDPTEQALAQVIQTAMPDHDEQSAALCAASILGQLGHFVTMHNLRGNVAAYADLSQVIRHVVAFSMGGVLAAAALDQTGEQSEKQTDAEGQSHD